MLNFGLVHTRFICAGILLPYPSDNLVLDVVLMLLFLGLETLRIFYGETDPSSVRATGLSPLPVWPFAATMWTTAVSVLSSSELSLPESCDSSDGLPVLCGCSGWKGNLCERSLASCMSLFILFPCAALAVYVLLLQTFVLRLEFVLSAVLLCFYGLELLLGLFSLSAFSRWPNPDCLMGGV